jgi:hypothetical protein
MCHSQNISWPTVKVKKEKKLPKKYKLETLPRISFFLCKKYAPKKIHISFEATQVLNGWITIIDGKQYKKIANLP